MTTPANLADRLSNVTLSNAASEPRRHQTHHLSFIFPAVDILPANCIDPYLETPANISWRHRPDPAFFTNNSTSTTAFFTNLRVKPTPSGPPPLAIHDGCAKVTNAIKCLKRFPGRSVLHMASFWSTWDVETSSRLLHRFRIVVESEDSYWPSCTQDFELEDSAWRHLMNYAHRKTWVSLLQNLVTRASERAYFEVRGRVAGTFLAAVMEEDEALWDLAWYSSPPRSAEELFMARLIPATADDAGALESEGDRVLRLNLPCGHEVSVRKVHIVSLGPEAITTQQCPLCGARILQPIDDKERWTRKQNKLLQERRSNARKWRPLDDPRSLSAASRPHSFNTTTILEVLGVTRESFHASELIHPLALCPVEFEETASVMSQFERIYGGTSLTVNISAADLLESLYGLAMGTCLPNSANEEVLGNASALSPGWSDFLLAWLTRTVNFLVCQRCTRQHCDQGGVHTHRGALYYSSHAPDVEAEERQMLEANMRDLETQMEDAGLSDDEGMVIE